MEDKLHWHWSKRSCTSMREARFNRTLSFDSLFFSQLIVGHVCIFHTLKSGMTISLGVYKRLQPLGQNLASVPSVSNAGPDHTFGRFYPQAQMQIPEVGDQAPAACRAENSVVLAANHARESTCLQPTEMRADSCLPKHVGQQNPRYASRKIIESLSSEELVRINFK